MVTAREYDSDPLHESWQCVQYVTDKQHNESAASEKVPEIYNCIGSIHFCERKGFQEEDYILLAWTNRNFLNT